MKREPKNYFAYIIMDIVVDTHCVQPKTEKNRKRTHTNRVVKRSFHSSKMSISLGRVDII